MFLSYWEIFAKLCKKRLSPIVRWSRHRRDSLLQAIDPTYLRATRLWVDLQRPRAGLVCIYRSPNAERVEKLVQEASSLNMRIALWALDRSVEKLSPYTIGSGPGLRLELFNRLCENIRALSIDQLVVTDDDVSFMQGNLSQLLIAVKHCGFGLAQPAIAKGWNHEFTKPRFLTLARLTSFVEVGPMFVLNKPWLTRVLPFPEEFGMGWGLDLIWQDLISEGCRLGIVDSVCLCHVLAPRIYEQNSELMRLKALMKSRKVKKLADVQHGLAVWRPWQAEPPWLNPRPAVRSYKGSGY